MLRATFLAIVSLALIGCASSLTERSPSPGRDDEPRVQVRSPDIQKLLDSAREQIKETRGYSQGYVTLAYPGGDVPMSTGACTDVVIRAFRNAGIDLQKEVHEDMLSNFSAYPAKWGRNAPDANIDHRRVPNLQTFFTRRGKSVPISLSPDNYLPGDIVTWDLDGKGMTHIGLVSDVRSARPERYMIIHNIGGGTNLEDRLFTWKITGHFRYF